MLWTPPAPQASLPASRPPLWSIRRTALAIVAAVAVGVLTAIGVSYADLGSSGPATGPRGGFGNRGFGSQGFGGNGFGGQGFGGQGFGGQGFGGQGFGGFPGGGLGGAAPQLGTGQPGS